MRSLLAGLATTYFVIAGLSFTAPSVVENASTSTGLDGDPGAVAITLAARTLFFGLAILSLALVEWNRVRTALKDMLRNDRTDPGPVYFSDDPELMSPEGSTRQHP